MNIKKYMDYLDKVSKCDDFSIIEMANDEDLPLQGRALMCAVALDSHQHLAFSIWCARTACERSKGARIDRRAYAAIEFREKQLSRGPQTEKDKQNSTHKMLQHFDQTMTALRECNPNAKNAVAACHWLCFSASKKMAIGCLSHLIPTFENENEAYDAILDWIKREVSK